MKIAIVTDTHFGARNDNQNFNEYFYKFYENIFFPTLKEQGITTCVHMGDVVDRRKFISYRIANDFRKRFISTFQKANINLHIIIGNHDTYYKNTNEVNAMEELVGQDRFKIYTNPEVVDFDGIPIQFIPWINSGNYKLSMDALSRSNAQIAMGHLEIDGFEMYKGFRAEGSYHKDLFKRFDIVMSGHFHHKSDDGQIYYLGTPYEIYWNDWQDPKGFHIFDTETRELERIINPYTIFEKIYYDDSINDYSDRDHDFDKYREKYVKLIVVSKKDLYQFDTFVDKLLKADAFEVKIVEDFSEFDADNVSDDIVENTQDTMTLLEMYIDELDVELSKPRLKSKMRELYTEAQDLEL
jgi:DNA repair exonuclease SbcCD nuclease subunit